MFTAPKSMFPDLVCPLGSTSHYLYGPQAARTLNENDQTWAPPSSPTPCGSVSSRSGTSSSIIRLPNLKTLALTALRRLPLLGPPYPSSHNISLMLLSRVPRPSLCLVPGTQAQTPSSLGYWPTNSLPSVASTLPLRILEIMLSVFVSSNLIMKRLGLKSLEGSPQLSELGLSNIMIWQLLLSWVSALQNFWPKHRIPSCLCPFACVFPSAWTRFSLLCLIDSFLSRLITPYLSFRTYLGHFLSKENGEQRVLKFPYLSAYCHSPAPKNTRNTKQMFLCKLPSETVYKSLKKKKVWGRAVPS